MIYEKAPELEREASELVKKLGLNHIDTSRVVCLRSRGSKSRRILARCHTVSKVVQKALGLKAHYVIEVVSENFDRLSREEKTKTLIHELLHIPKSFGGGFRHHRNYVTRKKVNKLYDLYLRR
jgi:predicted metallopeptidase